MCIYIYIYIYIYIHISIDKYKPCDYSDHTTAEQNRHKYDEIKLTH